MSNFIIGMVALLKALPTLIGFIYDLRKTVESTNRKIDSAKKLKELKEAIIYARETKNTSKFDALFK